MPKLNQSALKSAAFAFMIAFFLAIALPNANAKIFQVQNESVDMFVVNGSSGNIILNPNSGFGNVGIGNTIPNVTLDVSGDANISGTLSVGSFQMGTASAASMNVTGTAITFTSENGSLYQPVYGTDDDLILYLPFSRGGNSSSSVATSNLTVKDRSPYGNDGQCYGTDLADGCNWTTGKYGYGLFFDGVDDRVVTPMTSLSSMGISNQVTLEAWVNIKNKVDIGRFVSKGGGRMTLGSPGNQIMMEIKNTGGTTIQAKSPDYSANTWIHVAGTYDGNEVRLYIDGILKDSASQTGNIEDAGDALTIGNDATGTSQAINGSIDEVRVYKRALTAEEIRTHYLRGKGFGAMGAITADKFRVVNTSGSKTLELNQTSFDVRGADGVSVLYVDKTTSNVGIGTASPSSELHIIDDSANSDLNIERTGTNPSKGIISAQSDLLVIGTTSNDPLRIITNNAAAMDIDTSGNVGIGTTSPATTLDVKGKANFTGNFSVGQTSNILFVDNTSSRVGIGTANPRSDFTVATGSTSTIEVIGGTDASGADARLFIRNENTNVDWGFVLDQSDSDKLKIDSDSIVHMTLDTSGNVGIGTTSPNDALEVVGNVRISGSLNATSINISGDIRGPQFKKNVWATMAQTPQAVGYGASLIYTGDDFIYAIVGFGENEFFRYSISNDSWSQMADYANSATSQIRSGADLIYTGGDYIYGTRGSGTTQFERYSIINNTWENRASTPAAVGCAGGGNSPCGGSLVYTGGDYIYALRGVATTTFYRYSISSDSWSTIGSTPDTINDGNDMVYTGGDYIYALRGQSTDFYKYSIANDAWTSAASTPATVEGGGSLVYTGGDYIYALRGNNSKMFWRYSISEDFWMNISIEDAPSNVNDGGSLVYTGDYIYALEGGQSPGSTSRVFWRYSIGGDVGNDKLASSGLLLRGNISTEGDFGIIGGNVGIGTTSPATTLDVKGKANFTGNFSVGQTSNILFVDNTSGRVGIGTTNPEAGLDIAATGVSVNSPTVARHLRVSSSADSAKRLNIGFDDTNNVAFLRANWEAVQDVPLVLQPGGGLVGIGTTGPGYPLTVQSSTNPQIYVNDSGGGGTAQIRLDDGTGTVSWLEILIGGNTQLVANSGDMIVETRGSGKDIELKGGNVGIGTANPNALLHVNDTTGDLLNVGNGTNSFLFVNSSGFVGIGNSTENVNRRLLVSSDGFDNSAVATVGIEETDTPEHYVLSTAVKGDSFSRWIMNAWGTQSWGSGAAAQDVFLYRSAVSKLKIDSDAAGGAANLEITGNVSIGWERVTNTCASALTCDVSCSSGKVLLGGGCDVSGQYLESSYPLDDDTWRCDIAISASITSYAICARME
jgi:hypothetical protein